MRTFQFLRSLLESAALSMLRLTLFLLPRRGVFLLGRTVGWFMFHVLRLKRGITLSNLEQAFGTAYSPKQLKRIASRCFLHFGAVFAEFLVLPRLSGSDLDACFELENPEVLDDALGKGRGILITAGHLGNWELLGGVLARRGYPFTIYVGRQRNLKADALVNWIRWRMGIGTVPKGWGAMRSMLRVLKDNQVLGMLSDQHFSRNRHFVRFFGHLISAAPGLGSLSNRLKPELVFAETYQVAPFQYRTRFFPFQLSTPSGSEEYDLLDVTQKFMDLLEAAVRRHPEQYFWMHRSWRQPPAQSALSPVNREFLAGRPPPETPPSGPGSKPGPEPGPEPEPGSDGR
ncbi:MAG: lysophospholipid acyltransferase family protein [bacterium]